MKIGILTFHYTSNQGSVMQALCSYRLLREAVPEAQVEIINLVPAMRELKEVLFLKKSFPLINIPKLLRYVRLRRFTRRQLALSPRSYTDRLGVQIQFINRQKYDCIVTGSDTVWFHSKWLRYRIPSIYFLPEGIHAKKLAFAVSVDPLNCPEVYLSQKDVLQKVFNSFASITVRDSTTGDLLHRLGCDDHRPIADPSLLYDFEDALGLEQSNTAPMRPARRIGLGIADRELTARVIRILEKSGTFEIVDFLSPQPLSYDYFRDELNRYHTFDVFIGDRFHRTIFSLKLSNALTIYLENPSFNKQANSKGRDLLTKLGLQEFVLDCSRLGVDELERALKERISCWDDAALRRRNEALSSFISENRAVFKESIRDVIRSSGPSREGTGG